MGGDSRCEGGRGAKGKKQTREAVNGGRAWFRKTEKENGEEREESAWSRVFFSFPFSFFFFFFFPGAQRTGLGYRWHSDRGSGPAGLSALSE